MEVKSILIILALNIILPTLDTFSDINLVIKLYRGSHHCKWDGNPDDYEMCLDDPDGYCFYYENNQNVCRRDYNPKMATAMLTPFLLNYIVCFKAFLRKEKNRKFTFIFALLNIYPQFGIKNYYEKS